MTSHIDPTTFKSIDFTIGIFVVYGVQLGLSFSFLHLLFGQLTVEGEELVTSMSYIGVVNPSQGETKVAVMLEYQATEVDSWWHVAGR